MIVVKYSVQFGFSSRSNMPKVQQCTEPVHHEINHIEWNMTLSAIILGWNVHRLISWDCLWLCWAVERLSPQRRQRQRESVIPSHREGGQVLWPRWWEFRGGTWILIHLRNELIRHRARVSCSPSATTSRPCLCGQLMNIIMIHCTCSVSWHAHYIPHMEYDWILCKQ